MIKKINYNLDFSIKQTRILLIIVVILLIVLLFRKKLNSILEKAILFCILFFLILIISKNLIITFILTSVIFLFFSVLMKYRNTIENFQDLVGDSTSEEVKKSKEGIQELLKLMNGGIKLGEEDLKETNALNINLEKYSDDKTPNALKIAQKETYELINTVNALKDTITTLAPVLQEGKKLMSMFENIKI